MVQRHPLRLAVMEAEKILVTAGIASPRVDAELLAAHVLGLERSRLHAAALIDSVQLDTLHRLVQQRAKRIPLQHLTGWAPLGNISVDVGPGVFIPRPETEMLLEFGLAAIKGKPAPVIVDLCTGSGALALALAHERPDAQVHAVEKDSTALVWSRRNADARAGAGDTPIRLHAGDVADFTLLSELDFTVDLVVCNPPYVPTSTDVPPEVAGYDPPQAVFGGADGLDIIRHVITCAARLLKSGGAVAIEHDDTHGDAVPELLRARRVLTDVQARDDLTGRPRFATAVRT
ncbi:peptide chain release factor N(5)-glutamine methyltransferase [Pseudonocardiaceae bacterium YIM PH 21723]|nr:peptide chain release factor N(5)-glutamine methyltransferase [Pseudonocardiaceae bacterium YIM PH 21723]